MLFFTVMIILFICFAENTVQELRLFHDSFNVSSEAILLHFM